jgi:hypothetical protein
VPKVAAVALCIAHPASWQQLTEFFLFPFSGFIPLLDQLMNAHSKVS